MPLVRERKARLENIQLGIKLMSQLGNIDEKTALDINDLVKDIVLADKLKQAQISGDVDNKRLHYPISDRLVQLGYGTQPKNILKSIGKIASSFYKIRYDGQLPPKREQFVDGTTRMVNAYSEEDLDLVDQAIERKLGQLSNKIQKEEK